MGMKVIQKLCDYVACTLFFSALSFSHAMAQEKHALVISAENAQSRYVQQLSIDVDDVASHQVRVFEYKRVFSVDAQPIVDGEKIVEQWGRGFSNYANGVGPAWNYTTYITDKGNKIFAQSIGTSDTRVRDNGSRYGSYHGTSQMVGRIGRFAKIRGTFVDVAEFDTDPGSGFTRGTSRGEYWFGD
jgi:hypothetical protein